MVRKIFVILLFSGLYIFAQSGIEVNAYTDSSDYLVGDRINYTIEVTRDEGVTVFQPVIKDSLKNVELIEVKPVISDERKGRLVEEYKFVLMGFDSTEVELTDFPVVFSTGENSRQDTVFTPPVYLVVRTMDVNPQGEIQDVKAPLTIQINFIVVLLIVLLIIILAIVFVFLFKSYKRRKAGPPPIIPKVVLPPHVEAIKLLTMLEEKKLWQQGNIKEFHTEITWVIRHYIERRFGVPAMEVPSSDLLKILRNRAEVKKMFDRLDHFFSNADMVKFAKFEPMPSVNEEMMKQAYEFVNETRPAEVTGEAANAK